jgi:hypothetical protein
VTFTAIVTPNTATGKVTFKDKTTTLGTGTITNGIAQYTASSLKAGSHPIVALNSGDDRYAPSMSLPLIQTVKSR